MPRSILAGLALAFLGLVPASADGPSDGGGLLTVNGKADDGTGNVQIGPGDVGAAPCSGTCVAWSAFLPQLQILAPTASTIDVQTSVTGAAQEQFAARQVTAGGALATFVASRYGLTTGQINTALQNAGATTSSLTPYTPPTPANIGAAAVDFSNVTPATGRARLGVGAVGQLADLSAPGPIGAATPSPGIFSSLAALGPSPATSVIANTPLDGVYAVGGGPLVDLCPGYGFGCPSVGHIRAQIANIATSVGDAGTQETGIYSYLVDATGASTIWATSTAYTAGQEVTANGYAYQETVASCTSASTGGGPFGTGSAIIDNTCRWTVVGSSVLAGRSAIQGVTLSNSGGAQSWAGIFDNFVNVGYTPNFAASVEVDVTNNTARDATGPGGFLVTDLYLGGSIGNNPITDYIDVSPFGADGSGAFMAHEGFWLRGAQTIKDHNIRMSTSATVGIFDDGAHATSSYYDGSTSPNGIILSGTYNGPSLIATKSIPGAGLNGVMISNTATGANTGANFQMTTGTTNSYVREDLFDALTFNILTGSALTQGMSLSTSAGPIKFAPNTTLVINGTSGVSCSGAPSSSFATIDGLVTHC